MARGKPNNPAPVSGPGALSRRTDGGPGSKTQPLRVATGGSYGEAQASENQQKAAPLAGGGTPPPMSLPAGGPAPPIPGGEGVFGPTTRPGESPLMGAPQPGMAQEPPNADDILRQIYGIFPHPQLLRLIRQR